MSATDKTEPILIPDDNRFVMFPIKYDDVWQMYKKQLDCFWRVEEIDLSKDLTHWKEHLDKMKNILFLLFWLFLLRPMVLYWKI
jgi:ribonucleoside-diphosphate reductase subunit M2